MHRRVWVIVLLLGGLGLLLYGSLFHVVMVAEEKERAISIAIPDLAGSMQQPLGHGARTEAGLPKRELGAEDDAASPDVDPFRSPPANGVHQQTDENPFESPAASLGASGVRFEKVTEKFLEARAEPEWMIVRDVTVGGVTRLENGQLKRTYSGKAPTLCPT